MDEGPAMSLSSGPSFNLVLSVNALLIIVVINYCAFKHNIKKRNALHYRQNKGRVDNYGNQRGRKEPERQGQTPFVPVCRGWHRHSYVSPPVQ